MPELEFLRPEVSQHAESWQLSRDEGELAVDVYELGKAIYIKTAIAGVRPEHLKISLSSDMLTIRGVRHEEEASAEEKRYLCQECHWGPFSRTIILPAEIDAAKAEATFKSGLLVIKLPKTKKKNEIKVRVEEE
ncbi:Hsp20/alpha crystallin family protein [Candidatus Uhrbacteria bacterium]|nr:Hsp20/alpha crystallin family protein [Candidatus Uhrbacteria bacterium]